MKCDTPARRSSSSREPPANIKTRLVDWRSGIDSTTSRAPPGSAWTLWEVDMGSEVYVAMSDATPEVRRRFAAWAAGGKERVARGGAHHEDARRIRARPLDAPFGAACARSLRTRRCEELEDAAL